MNDIEVELQQIVANQNIRLARLERQLKYLGEYLGMIRCCGCERWFHPVPGAEKIGCPHCGAIND